MRCFFIAMMLLVLGCDSEEDLTFDARLVCDDSSRDQRHQFIVQCIKGANPKSDEEPEDWIEMCQEMAEKTYCKEVDGFYYGEVRTVFTKAWVPCTKAKTQREKNVCGLIGPDGSLRQDAQ